MKNIIGIIIFAGISYLGYIYVSSLTESSMYAQSKEIIAKDDKRLIGAKFTNKGRYGNYMLRIEIRPKDHSLIEYYCGHSDGMIACSRSPESLNKMIDDAHGSLKMIL